MVTMDFTGKRWCIWLAEAVESFWVSIKSYCLRTRRGTSDPVDVESGPEDTAHLTVEPHTSPDVIIDTSRDGVGDK